MFNRIVNKTISGVFLFIFFTKMAISVAPLLIGDLDEKCVYNVIMQLEIEHESPKGAEAKWEEILNVNNFKFSKPVLELLHSKTQCFEDAHVQSFYPSVPTPPPNV
jgi:hypothetical protein